MSDRLSIGNGERGASSGSPPELTSIPPAAAGSAPIPECLQAALYYLKIGLSALSVCPPDHQGVGDTHAANCSSPGKSPWGEWKKYQEGPATPDKLISKWQQNPYLNVGMAFGP